MTRLGVSKPAASTRRRCRNFSVPAMQAPDFAANKEKIAQQLLDLPPVRLEIERVMRVRISTSEPSVSIFAI
ncbi:MAG TPA: hypothetical protein VM574_08230 [Terrimicrobiaceae bacterium]|nr:hypothetical protein [Terrimicrobiaceae bacterium]